MQLFPEEQALMGHRLLIKKKHRNMPFLESTENSFKFA